MLRRSASVPHRIRLPCSYIAGAALLFAASFANAAVFELPEDGSNVVGVDTIITAQHSDTLLDIARRYSIGYEEIIRANPSVDMWLPGEGTQVLVPGRRILPPGARDGVIVNLPEHRLYYFPKLKKGEKPVVITYPVSTGKFDRKTPLGQTRVAMKTKNPSWHPPESIRKEHAAAGDPIPRVVPPGPKNPLGAFAMRLAMGDGTYLIHGTNNPVAVGLAITHGCVRMYPEDIAELFSQVPVGTKVSLVNEPIKLADVNGELWIEAHPPVEVEGDAAVEPSLDALSQMLQASLGERTTAIHWDFAGSALQLASGMPTMIGLEIPEDAPSAAPTAQSLPSIQSTASATSL
jgi:L,D-transpeptidase ErfK/SrfK